MARQVAGRPGHKWRAVGFAAAAAMLAISIAPSGAAAQEEPDPRIGLDPGWLDAESAISNLEMLDHDDRPPGFFDPANPGSFAFAQSDIAFSGEHVFIGSFNGFNIYDISDPTDPVNVTNVVCPGGQGDVSVRGNLLFMSVEESRARVDCGTDPTVGTRFQGVRIFDISDITNPVQIAAVQTCRGSHTHSLLSDPDDSENLYVYVSGTAGVRPETTLAGCNNNPPDGENPSRWRIDVIQVPLAAPGTAAVVSGPRLFQDPETGALDGLQNAPPTPNHPSGAPWGPTPITDACHDITTFPEIGLAAGACEGNGILIDISDPVNPVRIDEVADPNFAYWHGATFTNDGSTIVFTDEWGGGTGARCRETDQPEWGANAIFDVVEGDMELASYYKLPVPQTLQENCVAHIGTLVPVPGRDIIAQGWYQGGISMFDFTDSANPQEIGFFDRGSISPTNLVLGGFWSVEWYNGQIYGAEIARGLDTFGLVPSEHLTAAEVGAAEEVHQDEFNAQHQTAYTWEPSFNVARARFDQLARTCTSTITDRRSGTLLIDEPTCLDGATINGAVVILPGGSLLSDGSQIRGGVAGIGGEALHLYDTDVRGAFTAIGMKHSVAVVDSSLHGVAVLTNNRTGDIETVVSDNTVRGLLVCSGNSPAPINLGAANDVRGLATGQCSSLD
ncbi:MAG: LVIVD repeat-containing protein [Acidimicrobiales bacterium]